MVCLTLKPDFSALTGWVALGLRENDTGGCQWPVTQVHFKDPVVIGGDRAFQSPGMPAVTQPSSAGHLRGRPLAIEINRAGRRSARLPAGPLSPQDVAR